MSAKWRSILSFVSRDGGIRTVIASAVQGEVLEILLQCCKEKFSILHSAEALQQAGGSN